MGDPDLNFSTMSSVAFIDQWPSLQKPDYPDHLPLEVLKPFKQAVANADLPEHEEPAAIMFGRTLEVALKVRFPKVKGTLHARIAKLGETNLLTQELCDWAGHIKFIRNDAIHEVEPMELIDVKALHAFTDMLLRYVFTLPGMLKENQEKIANLAAQKDDP